MTLIPPVTIPVPVDPVLVNSLKPDILFRFMNVRGPQKETAANGLRYFISNVYDSLETGELTEIQEYISTLFPTLISRLGTTGELSAMRTDVATYKGTTTYIDAADDYATLYPEWTSFIAWLDVYAANSSINTVKSKFSEIFGVEASTFTAALGFKQSQCVFWDNLLANLFDADNPFLVTLACKYLGALHLAKTIAGAEGTAADPTLAYVYRAKTLVPKWVYELHFTAGEDADEDVGDQEPVPVDNTALQTRFTNLNKAAGEIRKLINKNRETRLREIKTISHDIDEALRGISAQTTEDPTAAYETVYNTYKELNNPFEILSGISYGFSTTTTELFSEFYPSWTVLDLNNLLDLFIAEVEKTASKLGALEREYCVRIGSTIVSQKELCADMTDNDPCAVFERKNFASRGSFINSALIGDLLLTEQQLIRYDAGEVAHVEAVMMGLEKVRTHRRLNRTETTTTFERESVNETERETQTTERFSMEKETSNVVQQDFQIDAGVNVTARYGVVNLTSSLDSSYGYSQLQSQQTATSFSKDVTNRALTRVKELVRETQTVTVINEIEETSVNTITNDSTDHINGVYRWLNKFYLNKVVNYGRRLMFEFSVPEPANFYIFRKMARPQNGATVEKPIDPSLVMGPDGFRLLGPNVLTDANYAFWVAQYDVPNADAPPQEFIQVSRAFKNEYSTAQSGDVYSSFSTDIAIEEGYEAISADVYTEWMWWDTTHHFINGRIGNCNFGHGSVNNLPLNNVRNTVGLSVLNSTMGYTVNVKIKAQRSPEAYNQWRLSAYAKIIDAYNQKKSAYEQWLNEQYADNTFGFTAGGNNPEINREIEKEELKKRVIELFTGQRYESFDAATNGIQNVSGYPEILFQEAIKEGNLVKFFEQAFEWEHMTYIFYPYFWGRKTNWLTLKNLEDTADPLFTKFLQAGQARVMVPARPDFENYLLMFNLLTNAVSQMGCAWNFTPSMFGTMGVSNEFSPGVTDPVYMSVTTELLNAQGMNEDNGTIIGVHVQKVPTNLVYVVPNSWTSGTLPGLPDNSADADIAPYI